MKEEFIPNISTPQIPDVSEEPASKTFHEAHMEGLLHEAPEEEISITRIFILKKYAIPPEHVIVIAPLSLKKSQRQIRAFSILTNTEDPQSGFYAEGHTNHATLYNAIVEKFGQKIGIQNFGNLFDEDYNIKKPWVIRKGFLDPLHNGFEKFPNIRKALIDQLDASKNLNGLSVEEIKAMKKKKCGLPNWFLSADSSKES